MNLDTHTLALPVKSTEIIEKLLNTIYSLKIINDSCEQKKNNKSICYLVIRHCKRK